MSLCGIVLIVMGALFWALAGLGLLRMPDVFNRLQAGTKASTLGVIATIAGAMCLKPDWWLELLVIMILVLVGAPVSASVLARAVKGEGE